MSDKKATYQAFPFIKSENVDLCPPNVAHIILYSRWRNHPRARRYSRNIFPQSADEMKKWFEPRDQGVPEGVDFEIWHKKDKIPIGLCGISHINWVNRSSSSFMIIGDPFYWNKNLGTEASRMMINYGFMELNLYKIYANIFEPNIGSWKVAEKDGFKLEGIQKRAIFIDGEYVDDRMYCIFKDDWLKREKERFRNE